MKMAKASSLFFLKGIVAVILAALLISISEASNPPAPRQAGAVPCSVVIPEIAPCRLYIDKSEPEPSKACCDGVKDINDRSKTRSDRVEACNCIKQALSLVGKYDPDLIPLIPKKCGFSFPLPAIKKDTNCNEVVPPRF